MAPLNQAILAFVSFFFWRTFSSGSQDGGFDPFELVQTPTPSNLEKSFHSVAQERQHLLKVFYSQEILHGDLHDDELTFITFRSEIHFLEASLRNRPLVSFLESCSEGLYQRREM